MTTRRTGAAVLGVGEGMGEPFVSLSPLAGRGVGGLRPPFLALKNADAKRRLW